MEKTEITAYIDQGLLPDIRPGSSVFVVLQALLTSVEGTTHSELMALTGLNKKTLDSALLRLNELDLSRLGLKFKKEKLNGNRYRYSLSSTGEESTLDGLNVVPVTETMREGLFRKIQEGVFDQRGLELDEEDLDWGIDETIAHLTARNATWACSVGRGEFFAVNKILRHGLEGQAVRSNWLRKEWISREGGEWSENFFHQLAAVTHRYAPELGFVIHPVENISERGFFTGVFIDPELRKKIHRKSPPLKRTGLETCFDRVRAFDPKECKRRVEEVKQKPIAKNFPFPLFEAVIRDQQRKVERSAVQLSHEIGISRAIIQRWMLISIEKREDWGVYLRSRIGDRGLECVLYEGPIPV